MFVDYNIFLAKQYPRNHSTKVAIAQGPIANAQRIDIAIIMPMALCVPNVTMCFMRITVELS